MKNETILRYAFLALCLLGFETSLRAKQEQPNIIFFVADDMYPEMFNCLQPEGEGQVLSPNLDRLAREGTVMANGYVSSPVCNPSRFALLTGKYASRAQNRAFLDFTEEQDGQTVIQWNTYIKQGEPTLQAMLKGAGYVTGFAGKAHVIELESKKMERFPDYWGDPAAKENKARLMHNYNYVRKAIRASGFDYAESIYADNPGFIGMGELAHQNMEWITKGGLDFIDQSKGKPFFLYFATTIPHGPTDAAHAWKGNPLATPMGYIEKAPEVMPARSTLEPRLQAAGIKRQERNNPELTLWLDDALGSLLDQLEEHGVLDNTVIFFFNDHGQKAKGHLYQGGVHDPCIVWRSKGFAAGPVSEVTVQNIDFAPTILDLAGVDYGAGTFDGVSFKPVLDGSLEETHDSLYFELGFARAIMKGKYKYLAVRYPEAVKNRTFAEREAALTDYNEPRLVKKMGIVNTDPSAPYSHFSVVPGGELAEHQAYGKLPGYFDADQLYDLEADPGETHNLAANPEFAETLKALKAELQTYLDDLPGTFEL